MRKEKKEKKKFNWKQWIPMLLFMLVGAGCGILIVQYIDGVAERGTTFGQDMMIFALLLIAMYLCMLIQIVIHEAGHLVFGLLSGYQFSSFRIGSFMWILEEGKLRLKRLSLAGTGGQCLMSPPDLVNGKIPVILYNMGGSLMNLLASLVCGLLYLLIGKVNMFTTILMIMVLVGIAFAAMNGVPMRLGTVDNDGYNAFSLRKDSGARYSFWFQMKVNEQISKGVRLKDMPEEWFLVPTDEEMKNSMIAVQGVFTCNRLIDERKFEEADSLMQHLLSIESGIVGLHRSLMICDRLYCELIGENRTEVVDEMLTKEQRKFMKSMKTFPTVLRTEYAYELLAKGDAKKADKIRKQFEKMASKYPYPSEIQAERELMKWAEKLFV